MKKTLLAWVIAASHVASAIAAPTFHLIIPIGSGGGENPAGALTVTPGSLAFGDVQAGTSVSRAVRITNSSSTAQTAPQVAITQNPLEYAVSHDCPVSLGQYHACTATVTYTPTVSPQPGALDIEFTPGGRRTVALTGGALSDLLSGGGAHDFGPVILGESASHTFALKNDGNGSATLAYGALLPSLQRSGDCADLLGAGASCALTLTWSPTTATPLDYSATVNGQHSGAIFALSGTTLRPAALQGQSSQDFGEVVVGKSQARTWTIANTGQAVASLTYSELPAQVSRSGSCTSTLAGEASCTVILTWSPAAEGELDAVFMVGDQTLGLTGSSLLLQDFATDDLRSIVAGPAADWTQGANGWQSSFNSSQPGVQVSSQAVNLEHLKSFSVTMTSYFDSPTGAMHLQYAQIALDNGTVWVMGSRDSWVSVSSGLILVEGWDGVAGSQLNNNLINRVFKFDVPAGRHIVGITFQSHHVAGYVSATRGMKNFSFAY